jgi:hypothetical protein
MAIPATTARMPTFPIDEPPLCKNKNCNQPCVRAFTAKGRPVYGCPCQPKGVWCTYDDDEGVSPENPACKCGYFCRKDFSAKRGQEFLKCAVGKCDVFILLSQAPSYSLAPTNPSAPPYQILSATGSSFAQAPHAQAPIDDIDGEFKRLLRHVESAAPMTTFPSQNGMTDATSMEKLAQDTMETGFQIRSSRGLDRNEKVGAAGEYFVSNFNRCKDILCTRLMAKVVLLLHHVLSGQVEGRHWRSKTRNSVKKHLGCPDWPDYTEDEDDADIIFLDDHGTLTTLLITKGYLDPHQWNGRQPKYLIEVKSTLGSRTKDFYLSPKQFYTVCLLTLEYIHQTTANQVSHV